MSINGGGGNSGHCQLTFHYLNYDNILKKLFNQKNLSY
jgi:hypothetical protein